MYKYCNGMLPEMCDDFIHKIENSHLYCTRQLPDSFLLPNMDTFLAWLSNYIYHEIWDLTTYPFSNSIGADVEV